MRLIDSIDSEKNQTGDTFHFATLNSPLSAEGSTRRARTSRVNFVEVKSAGKFAGQSLVVLQLDSISANGKSYNLQTDQFRKWYLRQEYGGESRRRRNPGRYHRRHRGRRKGSCHRHRGGRRSRCGRAGCDQGPPDQAAIGNCAELHLASSRHRHQAAGPECQPPEARRRTKRDPFLCNWLRGILFVPANCSPAHHDVQTISCNPNAATHFFVSAKRQRHPRNHGLSHRNTSTIGSGAQLSCSDSVTGHHFLAGLNDLRQTAASILTPRTFTVRIHFVRSRVIPVIGP